MSKLFARVKRFYGTNPLHLLALIACFALAAYAATQTVTTTAKWPAILIWFLAAIIAHDLVLFPLYALADRSLSGALRAIRRRARPTESRLPALNYLRVPLLGTGLLLLLFFPGIIEQGTNSYHRATGLTQQPFLDRWLLLTAAMFGVSAIVYATRLGFVYRRDHAPNDTNVRPPTDHTSDEL